MPNDTGFPVTLPRGDVVEAALDGLLAPRKTLPPKLFYDEEGCRLFYRITELPEYYLTRTECALLADIGPIVAARSPAGSALIEYGASDETKADFLLRGGRSGKRSTFASYVPVDVAASALAALRSRLARRYPGLQVHPVVADFMQTVSLPKQIDAAPRLGFFPGSTIGNLEPAAAEAFLARVRAALGPDSRFLLGADLRKDPAVLIPAYDDAQGITAAFNLNLLVRLNREADADFELDAFSHRTVWNDTDSRIEMHLVSRRDQTVHVAGRSIRFAEGETIHTENSYKHTPERLIGLAARAGWRVQELWRDPVTLFGVFLFESEADGA